MSAALEIMPCLRDRSSRIKLMRLRKPAGTAFASTASMDIPAGEMVQQGATQASMDSVDFDDESTVFLTAPKVAVSRYRASLLELMVTVALSRLHALKSAQL